MTDKPPDALAADSNAVYKRPMDLAILVAAHLMLAPAFLVLWTVIPLLVWLQDRGPVFFTQRRAGKNGRAFTVVKFRTMVPDAESMGPTWTGDNDPRVTALGKVLRRTALDELPETINILRGDMSFVGPRALEVAEQKQLEQRIPGFEERLKVRPGLTGMAQVYNLEDDNSAKLRLDLQYIHKMGLLLDLKLLLLSVRNSLVGRWDRRGGKANG